uniref:Integrase catalytic domain-containing protein n=1 Tax=Haemonchus contortus TaxID=6289 RepID=A0A7I4YLV6_HAECO
MSENAAREGRLFHLERTAPQAQQSLSRQSQSYPPSLSLLSQPHLRSRPQGVRSVTEDPLPAAHYRITSRSGVQARDYEITQLRQELTRSRADEPRADIRVPEPPTEVRGDAYTKGHPEWHKPFIRRPTVVERLLALARRHNPDVTLRLSEDNESQLAAVAYEDKAFLFLLQRLTISLNPGTVFKTEHLGAHDYVAIDAFLRSDYHRMIRSYSTKEIILPDWAQQEQAGYPYFTVFEIVQNFRGVRTLTQQLVDYLAEASQEQRFPDAATLFAQIEHIHTLVHNIDHRNVCLLTQFQIQHYMGQQQPPRLIDLLAYYDVHWADLQEVAAAATAAIAEARVVLGELSRILTSQLQQAQHPQHRRGSAQSEPQRVRTPPQIPPQIPPQQRERPAYSPPPQQQRRRSPQRPRSLSPERSPSPFQRFSVPQRHRSPSREPAPQIQQRDSGRQSPRRPQAPPTEYERPDRGGAERRERSQSPQPREEHLAVRCFFCDKPHYSSGCRIHTSLRERMAINAEKGGCFKCGAIHGEEYCTSTAKCKACGSKKHHAAFCRFNKDAEVDIDAYEYGEHLEDAMVYASKVRRRLGVL